ncbi:MAG TPA: ParA family protein [Ktedonobacterales bacterium]|jgi:chromosome partitioning protein|nr:ParA family protein [Ktedonobacterales bacterium]
MAVVTSIINLKGGVGKTTLTLALAHYLAGEHGKRVLVIDLDPQTNATIALVTERRWRERDQAGQTLYQLFKDQIENTRLFSAQEAILTRVSNVGGGIPGLDLLPSSIRLHRIQDRITKIADLDTFRGGPVYALREALRDMLQQYDHVLIDCPPNLGVITLNGIAISRYFLIPVVPDILSTLGVPLVLDRMADFALRAQHEIFGLGIVVSRFRAASRLHKQTVMSMRRDAIPGIHPPIFNSIITEDVGVAEAADVEETVATLRQKFGGTAPHRQFSALADEYLRYVGG